MLTIDDKLKNELLQCAKRYAPDEMCGVLVQNKECALSFIQMTNVHPDAKNYFELNMFEYEVLAESNNIVAIVHSHPTGSSQASDADLHNCNAHSIPYVIVGLHDSLINLVMPTVVPLVGRTYLHGVHDCFSIVRDYYMRELGIPIDNYARSDEWWTDRNNDSLYEKHYSEQGFVSVEVSSMSELQRHDVLICYWGNTMHPNHALIYLGDNGSLLSEITVPSYGARLYLHHPYGALSTRSILGESRFNSVKLVLRHRSLLT